MKPSNQQKAPAMIGCDYVRSDDWQIVRKTRKGWIQYANRLAKQHCKRDGFAWFGIVCWITWRDCYRVNLAGDWQK
jgi:hypothetical protein